MGIFQGLSTQPKQQKDELKEKLELEEFEDSVRKLKDAWKQLTPEEQQLEQLRAAYDMLSDEYVKVGDNMVSMWDYGVDRELEELAQEKGFLRNTTDTPEMTRKLTPGWKLRPHAHKMQLRPGEEERLLLMNMGRGYNAEFSPLHKMENFNLIPVLLPFLKPKLNFSYGVFCRPDNIEDALRDRYAQRLPEDVLCADRFYQDIILHSPQLETTVMAVAARDLPVEQLREEFLGRLGETVLGGVKLDPLPWQPLEEGAGPDVFEPEQGDVNDLFYLDGLLSPEALEGLPIASPDGRKILKDTTVFITAKPDGGLLVEAQSPGPRDKQEALLLAELKSKHVTYAVLDSFFGERAVDPVARLDIAACYLYHANGFNLSHARPQEGKYLLSNKLLEQYGNIFDPSGRLLVDKIPEIDAPLGLPPPEPMPQTPAPAPPSLEGPTPAPPKELEAAASLSLSQFALPKIRGSAPAQKAANLWDRFMSAVRQNKN